MHVALFYFFPSSLATYQEGMDYGRVEVSVDRELGFSRTSRYRAIKQPEVRLVAVLKDSEGRRQRKEAAVASEAGAPLHTSTNKFNRVEGDFT